MRRLARPKPLIIFLSVIALSVLIAFGQHLRLFERTWFNLRTLWQPMSTQSIGLGILGEVLSRTYFESQGKRSYTVAQTLNLEAQPARKAA